MDKAWVLILIALGIAICYYVIKTAVRNGILEAHDDLVKRLAAEEEQQNEVEK